MNSKVIFTGVDSQIGQYFSSDVDSTSWDLFDSTSWTKLLDSEVVFLILPKHQHTLHHAKQFILKAMDSNIKQIIKIGSLGPWRLIHNQIDVFLSESGINYTTFDIAPLMNNIFTEQYDSIKHTLIDYRGNAPAPYLDPRCLAQAIELSVNNPICFNRSYRCTGKMQYTIEDVKQTLITQGYPVQEIVTTTNARLHGNDPTLTEDYQLMDHMATKYITEGWYPLISSDLESFGLQSRTLDQFIAQDQHIFTKRFANDSAL